MTKSVALLLVLVFLTATCLIMTKPAVFSADVAEDSWVSKAPMQVARSGLGVAAVNGKIYAIGGSAENGVVDTNEEYDPETDTWTNKLPIPTPRESFAIAAYQNKIYCIDQVANEVYNPATDTWETKASMPMANSASQANVVGDKIYLISSSSNLVYEPATNSWTEKTPPQYSISPSGSAVIEDRIYFLSAPRELSQVWTGAFIQVYDAINDSWSTGPNWPISGYEEWLSTAGATSRVAASERVYFFDDTETLGYYPANGSWTLGASMPTARLFVGVGVIDDTFYVIGGSTEEQETGTLRHPSAVNEQYTPFGYGTVPLEIAVVSPENKTYVSSNVSLAFTVNKPALWMGYSLDGQDNVTIPSNITLSGLANGSHNVTVYAKDEFENTGASETVTFTIAKETEAFPIRLTVVAAFVVAALLLVAAVGVGLSAYLKKRK
jgi:hypothetical protein